ncbi:MAG: ParB/RepB/Spo0J family partition protein [Oscillospiraceae bacterium]|nr:ParB/RepB/Spo0J family partition protein [Oscillospiraceae bacterium]
MSAKSTGLGRGLGALLGDESLRPSGGNGVSLRIAEVEPNTQQPRRAFDEESLVNLAESIRLHGVLQPLLVRRLPTGYYQILAGERRWRAARLADLTEIPAIVLEADDRNAAELALIENLQREDLNPMEEAEGFRMLTENYGLTQEEVGARVGRSRPAVANSLRLLGLPEPVRASVRDGRLSAGHARAILSLSHPPLMEKAANTAMSQGMSVRQTEAMCKKIQEGAAPAQQRNPKEPNYLAEHERALSEIYGRKVRITATGQKGKLSMEFYDAMDLEELIAKLGAQRAHGKGSDV